MTRPSDAAILRGWWSVSPEDADQFTPEAVEAMNVELRRASEAGKQIVTIEGIRLTWHTAPVASGDEAWACDWVPDELNPGPECPYCAGQMCARFDGLDCHHDQRERHGYPPTTAMKRIGVVDDSGGGWVSVFVDRDLDEYPAEETVVYVGAAIRDERPALDRVTLAEAIIAAGLVRRGSFAFDWADAILARLQSAASETP